MKTKIKMEEYNQLFKSINTDGDGKLTIKEVCKAIAKLPEFSNINIDNILKARLGNFDPDTNSTITEVFDLIIALFPDGLLMDVSSFLELIEFCLVLQSLPRCNQRQTSVQKESLQKLFCLIVNDEVSTISKDEFKQLFAKIQALHGGKCRFTEELTYLLDNFKKDNNENIEMADPIDGIFHQMDKDNQGQLTVENVFQGLKFKLGLKLCHLSFAKHFIKFLDYPCFDDIDDSSYDSRAIETTGSSKSGKYRL